MGLARVKFKHVPSRYKPEVLVLCILYDTIRYSIVQYSTYMGIIIITLAWTFTHWQCFYLYSVQKGPEKFMNNKNNNVCRIRRNHH